MVGWIRHEKKLRSSFAVPQPPKGHARSLSEAAQLRLVRPLGFTIREDWGEGSWTARDLR